MQTPTEKDPAAIEAERKATLQLLQTLKEFSRYEPGTAGTPTMTIQPIDAARVIALVESMVPRNTWTPPLEWLQEAERDLQGATPGELVTAEHLYRAYPRPTRGRSGISGAEFPDFSACTPLVRACWLWTARAALALGGVPPAAPELAADMSRLTADEIATLQALLVKARGTDERPRPLATDGVRFA